MNKILFILTCLLLSSCASSMGSPKPDKVSAVKNIPKYSEADAKFLIEKYCRAANMKKVPRLRLVDVYVCGSELSLQVNRDLKEEHVKILLTADEPSQKFMIKDPTARSEIKKIIIKTYALSDEARFHPVKEEVVEKKSKAKVIKRTKKKA